MVKLEAQLEFIRTTEETIKYLEREIHGLKIQYRNMVEQLPRLYYVGTSGFYGTNVGTQFIGSLEDCKQYAEKLFDDVVITSSLQFYPDNEYDAQHIAGVIRYWTPLDTEYYQNKGDKQ